MEVALKTINEIVEPHDDRWNITKEDCGSDYYQHQNSLRNLLEEDRKKCLAINEWKEEDIRNRYQIYGIDLLKQIFFIINN